MRERHFPRVCGTCGAPMARQTTACWDCGASWASKRPGSERATDEASGRLMTRRLAPPTVHVAVPAVPAVVAATAGVGVAAGADDDDRWMNEGGREAVTTTESS